MKNSPIPLVAAVLLSDGTRDAGWIGIVNETGAPIRLLSLDCIPSLPPSKSIEHRGHLVDVVLVNVQ